MAGPNKTQIAGGLLVLLGIAGKGFLDDCARAGARGAGFLDDAARGAARGGRMVYGPEEVAQLGRGVDDAARLGGGLDDAAAAGARAATRVDATVAAHADDAPWLEALGDAGIDIGMEVVALDLDEPPPALPSGAPVRCPRLVTLTRTPEAWTELLGGLGVACAPIVVVGIANHDGTALRMGGAMVPMERILGDCAAVGAECIAIGCSEKQAAHCEEATRASLSSTHLQPVLRDYVRELVGRAFEQEAAPTVVAQLVQAQGRPTELVLARQVVRNSDGSPQRLPAGPPSRPPQTLVLAYDDFGPQALAYGLLGFEWWQWAPGGSWEPGDRFDVRVVVYRGISRTEVAAEYPTVEGRADYRYVSYDDAIAYFESALSEAESEPMLAPTHDRLARTRDRILAELAE